MPTKSITFKYPQLASAGRMRVVALQQYTDGDLIYVKDRDAINPVAFGAAPTGTAVLNVPVPSAGEIGLRFIVESGTSTFTEVDRFDRGISASSPTDGSQLVDSFFSQDLADRSIYAIAKLISDDPQFLASVPGFTFFPYASSQQFVKNNFTFRNDRFYRWVRDTSGSGVDPSVAANASDPGSYLDGVVRPSAAWQVASTSLKGSGTTTSDTEYSNAAFINERTSPASKRNVAQVENLLRSSLAPDLSAYARRDTDNSWTQVQRFLASATGVTSGVGDSSTFLATNEFVTRAVSAIGGISVLPAPVFWSRRLSAFAPPIRTAQTIVWEDSVIGAGLHSNGQINLPSSGYYLAFLQLSYVVGSSASFDANRFIIRSNFLINGVEGSTFCELNASETRQFQRHIVTGAKLFSGTANQKFEVQLYWDIVRDYSNSGATFNVQGNTANEPNNYLNNYVLLFRVGG